MPKGRKRHWNKRIRLERFPCRWAAAPVLQRRSEPLCRRIESHGSVLPTGGAGDIRLDIGSGRQSLDPQMWLQRCRRRTKVDASAQCRDWCAYRSVPSSGNGLAARFALFRPGRRKTHSGTLRGVGNLYGRRSWATSGPDIHSEAPARGVSPSALTESVSLSSHPSSARVQGRSVGDGRSDAYSGLRVPQAVRSPAINSGLARCPVHGTQGAYVTSGARARDVAAGFSSAWSAASRPIRWGGNRSRVATTFAGLPLRTHSEQGWTSLRMQFGGGSSRGR